MLPISGILTCLTASYAQSPLWIWCGETPRLLLYKKHKVIPREVYKRRGKATISNKEKELILCSLYVCKFADNPENYLDLGYYNKLMKDFKGLSMNMSHKYELEIHDDWRLE